MEKTITEERKFINGVDVGTPSERLNNFAKLSEALNILYSYMSEEERKVAKVELEKYSVLFTLNK